MVEWSRSLCVEKTSRGSIGETKVSRVVLSGHPPINNLNSNILTTQTPKQPKPNNPNQTKQSTRSAPRQPFPPMDKLHFPTSQHQRFRRTWDVMSVLDPFGHQIYLLTNVEDISSVLDRIGTHGGKICSETDVEPLINKPNSSSRTHGRSCRGPPRNEPGRCFDLIVRKRIADSSFFLLSRPPSLYRVKQTPQIT